MNDYASFNIQMCTNEKCKWTMNTFLSAQVNKKTFISFLNAIIHLVYIPVVDKYFQICMCKLVTQIVNLWLPKVVKKLVIDREEKLWKKALRYGIHLSIHTRTVMDIAWYVTLTQKQELYEHISGNISVGLLLSQFASVFLLLLGIIYYIC